MISFLGTRPAAQGAMGQFPLTCSPLDPGPEPRALSRGPGPRARSPGPEFSAPSPVSRPRSRDPWPRAGDRGPGSGPQPITVEPK